jgi:hypothetical protein
MKNTLNFEKGAYVPGEDGAPGTWIIRHFYLATNIDKPGKGNTWSGSIRLDGLAEDASDEEIGDAIKAAHGV